MTSIFVNWRWPQFFRYIEYELGFYFRSVYLSINLHGAPHPPPPPSAGFTFGPFRICWQSQKYKFSLIINPQPYKIQRHAGMVCPAFRPLLILHFIFFLYLSCTNFSTRCGWHELVMLKLSMQIYKWIVCQDCSPKCATSLKCCLCQELIVFIFF